MALLQFVLIVLALLLLFGGIGGHFGVWGTGPTYAPFYGPGMGIGTLLLLVIIIWMVW